MLPAEGKREHLWDDTLKGFGVMVTDKGVRSYLVQYRVGGRGAPTRRVTIGGHGNPWTAEKARDRAEEILEQVRRKIDPFDAQKSALAEEREAKRLAALETARQSRLIFEEIANRYIDGEAKKKLRTWAEVKSVIDRDLMPSLRGKPLTAISSAEISDILEEIAERSPSASRKAYNALSAVFGYATRKERSIFKTHQSPLREVDSPSVLPPRQRILSDGELRLIWSSAGDLGWPFCEIVRLLIATGQRLREVAHAPWTEFDLPHSSWTIPGTRTKNKLPMLVHLNEPARAIIKNLPRVMNDGDFLFSTTGKTAVSGFSRAKRRLDALMLKALRGAAKKAGEDPDAVKIADWRFHDLRRTMSTYCQRLGIPSEIVDRMQNHVTEAQSGTRKSYQLYQFVAEKKDGFEKWGRFVTRLPGKRPERNNVVELRAKA